MAGLINRTHFSPAGISIPILLNNVRCQGDETSLSQCEHNAIGLEGCTHLQDVVIACGAPDAPTHVHIPVYPEEGCIPMPPPYAVVKWEAGSNNNPPIMLFIVQYNTSYEPNTWYHAITVSGRINHARVELSPYVHYSFRVLARNAIGDSEPSMRTGTCETQMARPDMNPENVRIMRGHRNVLSIHWKPMTLLQLNGPSFAYRVEYKRRSATHFEPAVNIIDYRTDHVCILIPDTEHLYPYVIRIRARNVDGFAEVEAPLVHGYGGKGRDCDWLIKPVVAGKAAAPGNDKVVDILVKQSCCHYELIGIRSASL